MSTPDGWQNPLRDKRDKRMPRVAGPCAVVIFGVTGDLARKKLMPAIYDLANRGLLAPQFALVGFARRDWADEHFGEVVLEAGRTRGGDVPHSAGARSVTPVEPPAEIVGEPAEVVR